jgi:hypothetical protein
MVKDNTSMNNSKEDNKINSECLITLLKTTSKNGLTLQVCNHLELLSISIQELSKIG